MDIQETIRKELRKAKVSRYVISQMTEIEQASLCRFVAGEQALSLENAEKLLRFFGYTLAKIKGMPKIPTPRKRGRPRKNDVNNPK